MDPGVRSCGMEVNPLGYLLSKYECFLVRGCQDDLSKNLHIKLNRGDGNGKADDRDDYNSSPLA